MKKIAMILACILVMSGCSNTAEPSNIVSNTVTITPSNLEPVSEPAGETPDPNSPLPNEGASSSQASSSSASSQSASSKPASSSSQASSAASKPSSSAAPSSQAPSSKPAASSSSSAAPSSSKEPSSSEVPVATKPSDSGEIRAVWVSYLDFYSIAKGKTKAQFTANIDSWFKEFSDYGLNTVYAQVRPYGDTLYPSKLAPWSHTISATKTEGEDPGYDPLAIMIQHAKKYNLRFEAWLNPFRIRSSATNVPLSSSNPAKKLLEAGDRAVVEHGGAISYNPASTKARQMIVDVVLEIIKNYDVDGIHFDDYFSPTTEKAFDQVDYDAYRNGGGKLSVDDWRRENVNKLIKGVYSAIKNYDKSIEFGISPQAKMENNYHAQFVDVEKMINESGYIDYVCPQIYFGFENDSMPYSTVLAQWNTMVKGSGKDLYIGLGPYKSGLVDNWAGGGKNEWLENTDLTQRMVEDARNRSEYDGFAIFRSELFFSPTGEQASYINKERANLSKILD